MGFCGCNFASDLKASIVQHVILDINSKVIVHAPKAGVQIHAEGVGGGGGEREGKSKRRPKF